MTAKVMLVEDNADDEALSRAVEPVHATAALSLRSD
jgi:hypothetical protein